MQIVCPACEARYEVPGTRLAPGRRVKCARCGDSWTPIEPEPEPAPVSAPEIPPVPAPVSGQEPAPILTLSAAAPLAEPGPARRSSGPLLWAGWAATALLVVGCVLLASQFRIPIEHAWPPSERLYDLF